MLRISTAFLAVVSLFLSTITQAQVSDAIGDVTDPCIDIVQIDISANAETISATLWLDDEFCLKAQYQLHVDVDGDGASDYGYMAKLDKGGVFSFHGSPDLIVEIDDGEYAVSFDIPVSELVDEYGVAVDEVVVWFRTHFDDEADLFPDKFEDRIDLPLGGEVVKVIGPEGGLVVNDDPESPIFGTNITFHPGSVDVPVGISIKYEPELSIPSNPDIEETAAQPAFSILPHGLKFDPPVKISVPIPDADADGLVDGTDIPIDTGSLFFMNEGDTEMVRADTAVRTTAGFIETETSHFSIWSPWYGRWKIGSVVGYWIESLPTNEHFSYSSFEDEVQNAFQQWQQAVGGKVKFVEASSSSSANVIIKARDFCSNSYYFGIHCKDVAHANKPLLSSNWTVNFNTNSGWEYSPRLWVTGDYNSYPPNQLGWFSFKPFLRNALHEFGHVMGLPDYPDNTNISIDGTKVIMWYDEGFLAGNPLTSLDSWDISKVNELYPSSGCPCWNENELLSITAANNRDDRSCIKPSYPIFAHIENNSGDIFATINFNGLWTGCAHPSAVTITTEQEHASCTGEIAARCAAIGHSIY